MMLGLLGLFLAWVSAHGDLTDKGRKPGPQMRKNCGQQIFNKDPLGNIQDYLETGRTQADFNAQACNLELCRGRALQDNLGAVQHYSAGQTVEINYKIGAPHTGDAKLRVYDLQGRQYLETLKYFPVFASTSRPAQPDESRFSARMPDLKGHCKQPGDCVLQFLWDARDIKQTYPSCIDFTQ